MLFGLLMVISLANFFFIKLTEQEASQHLYWVNHTNKVIVKSERLLGSLRDAETGQRGYLLTSDPKYLEPYYTGVTSSQQQLEELGLLTHGEKEQQHLLNQTSDLVAKKFTELAETIDLAAEGNLDKALQVVKSDQGKILMGQIRVKLSQFLKQEQSLLATHTSQLEQSQQQLRLLFLAEAVLLVVIIFFISIYIQKTIIQPLGDMANAARKLEEGRGALDINKGMTGEIGVLAHALSSMDAKLRERARNLKELSEELKHEMDKALLSSMTDPLTGLYNRRKFEEVAENEIRRAHRGGYALGLIMFDIDYFKSINDQYGHVRGDEVLQEVAQCLTIMSRRPNDFAFRIGGEEFVFLTVSDDIQATADFAELIRANIEGLRIPNKGSDIHDFVTVSIGIATYKPESDESVYDLLSQADERLYMAKSLGRNRVVASLEK